MDWNRLFLSADGRIGRQTYWIGFLILLGAGVLLSWIPGLSLLLIYPWVCLFSKRFHDMGKSGWFAALAIALPAALFTVAVLSLFGSIFGAALASEAMGDDDAAIGPFFAGMASFLLFLSLGFLSWLGFSIWAGAALGEPGPNRHGPPPPLPSVGVSTPSAAAGA